MSDDKKDCCKKESSIRQGLIYGIIPHAGCIAFVIASVLGATAAVQLFKPLLMNAYFFYALIGMSLAFSTLSSALYLKNRGMLSLSGIHSKWKYLSTMYGSTIMVNLLLFLLVFPMLANASSVQTIDVKSASIASLRLSVEIPCSGHAPLITDEIKKLDGIVSIKFSIPNTFDVTYDSSKLSAKDITGLEIFKTYKATIL
jgi:hypothetical protein